MPAKEEGRKMGCEDDKVNEGENTHQKRTEVTLLVSFLHSWTHVLQFQHHVQSLAVHTVDVQTWSCLFYVDLFGIFFFLLKLLQAHLSRLNPSKKR